MMNIERKPFGKTARGEAVTLFEIRTPELTARILDYGATVQALLVPDKNGKPVDVVLGHDTIEGYETHDGYLGACVGRVANRLGGAQFTLNGKTYILAKNDGKNHLHGGLRGFDKYVWDAEVLEDGVKFSRVSPDGEEGYPGTLRVSVSYRVANGALTITYDAVSDQDTLCNLTNHSYFNLNGHASGSALGHRVTVDADFYLEADAASIPTGRKLPVKGTPMDFTEEKTLGLDIGADFTPLTDCCGYDQCYVIRDSGLRHAAWAVGPGTGIRMEVLTTLPGVHLYTANFLAPVTAGKDGAHYAARDAVCFETEDFPDAPNHPNFPDTTLLPGKPYSSTTIYRFDLAEM